MNIGGIKLKLELFNIAYIKVLLVLFVQSFGILKKCCPLRL